MKHNDKDFCSFSLLNSPMQALCSKTLKSV